jgi:hypothetical protein
MCGFQFFELPLWWQSDLGLGPIFLREVFWSAGALGCDIGRTHSDPAGGKSNVKLLVLMPYLEFIVHPDDVSALESRRALRALERKNKCRKNQRQLKERAHKH